MALKDDQACLVNSIVSEFVLNTNGDRVADLLFLICVWEGVKLKLAMFWTLSTCIQGSAALLFTLC